MPGAATLDKHEGLRKLLLDFAAKGKPIAAICAAPMVLGKLGLLKGKKATCYPGFEQYLEGAECVSEPVVRDGSIITGMGPGAAMEFALAIVDMLVGKEKVDEPFMPFSFCTISNCFFGCFSLRILASSAAICFSSCSRCFCCSTLSFSDV